MYAALIEQFSRHCCRLIATGGDLTEAEFEAFRTLLEARELHGTRLLGAMAGVDPSFDTVTGRCGLPPSFLDRRGGMRGESHRKA